MAREITHQYRLEICVFRTYRESSKSRVGAVPAPVSGPVAVTGLDKSRAVDRARSCDTPQERASTGNVLRPCCRRCRWQQTHDYNLASKSATDSVPSRSGSGVRDGQGGDADSSSVCESEKTSQEVSVAVLAPSDMAGEFSKGLIAKVRELASSGCSFSVKRL